jgi:hypothetical protein
MSKTLAPVAKGNAASHYRKEQRERTAPQPTPAYQQGVSGMYTALSQHADKLHPRKVKGNTEAGYALGETG